MMVAFKLSPLRALSGHSRVRLGDRGPLGARGKQHRTACHTDPKTGTDALVDRPSSLDACSKIALLPRGGFVLHVSLPQSEAKWQSSYGLLECVGFAAAADIHCGLHYRPHSKMVLAQ
jgi:hypothetical protein